jgi:predicted nucleic acid-binding protein
LSIAIDASIIVAWAIEDDQTTLSDAVQDALASGERAVAPALWPLEVANALLVAERHHRLSQAALLAFMTRLGQVPIETEPVELHTTPGPVVALARQLDLAVYDACYLELAARRGLPLATVDSRLAAAARKAGVPLWRPPRRGGRMGRS